MYGHVSKAMGWRLCTTPYGQHTRTAVMPLFAQMADYIRNERNVLDRLHHPGVAALQFTFQVGVNAHAAKQQLDCS